MSGPVKSIAIVGGGAAGLALAAYLAEAGKQVTLLEAGPAWRDKDLFSSQIWSRRLRWGGPHIESAGDNPIGLGFNGGWGLGGAALHHYGTWPRMKPEDFTLRSDHGQGLDWPIGYDALRPHYDSVQEEVGLSGDAEAEVWRPSGEPYPMGPLLKLAQGELLERAFAASNIRTAPAPMAINSEGYDGRPACIYDGWCDAGCPIMALANPHAVYLPRARTAGAQIIHDAPVVKLLMDGPSHLTGVEYLAEGKTRQQLKADLVILAGSVIGNPALMLASGNEWYPNGVGNGSDQVGRYVMTHGLIQVLGIFDGVETRPHMGVTGAHLISHDAYGKRATAGAFGSRQWLIAPSIKPNDIAGLGAARMDLNGAALEEFMQRAVKHGANMVGMCEELPDAENRVTLTDDQTEWGTPRTRVIHRFSDDAKQLWEKMREEGVAIFRKGGASDVWHTPMNSAHLMGGTIMGSDPAKSVADGHGKVHGIDNLYLAGPGLFPTSGAVNPTFTVHALARMTALHIVGKGGEG